MKKKIMNILFGTVLFYCLFLAVIYVTQRDMMYFPGGPRPDISTLIDKKPAILTITAKDGITFNAWYWPAEDFAPTIVFFHGNGQAYQYWVNKMKPYLDKGYGVYFTDYRGYGGVTGKPSEEGIYTDARAHLNALFAKGVQAEDMVYYGESLGTGVATQMATEFPPKAIIFESAYSATSEVAKMRFPILPVDLLMKDKFESIKKIPDLTMPKIFIHGERDMIIPIRFGRDLFEAAPEPKQWVEIKNSGHNALYDYGAQLHILQFLSTLHSS